MNENEVVEELQKRTCDGFDGNNVAKGYALTSIGRGLIAAANIFMSTSLLYLASKEVGCLDEEGSSMAECEATVYGFRPSSLLTNIAAITGLIAAFSNPIVGAIVDFTDHRYALGCAVSLGIILIQGIQAYSVSSTWFAMAILQAVVGFLYEIFLVVTFAYLPELSFEVGEEKMKNFSPKFTMGHYFVESMHLVIVLAISTLLNMGTVATAQVSQGLVCLSLSLFLGFAWLRYLPKVQAKRVLPEGKSLLTAGFSQLFNTVKMINRKYKSSIRLYLFAVLLAESGMTAFVICAVTFLNEVVKMSSTEIGISFLIVLVSIIPGAKISEFVTTKMNIKESWRLNLVYYSIATVVGALLIKDESSKVVTYLMAVCWGLGLGWYYSVETAFYAMLMPQEQATELSGLYSFCGIVFAWFPPLVFTIMNENGIHMRYGILHLVLYFLIAILCISLMPSWEECLQESHGKSIIDTTEIKTDEESQDENKA